MPAPMTPQHFWSKTQRAPNGCLIWTGYVNKVTGYGEVGAGRKLLGAHRYAYIITKGPIPPGRMVRHTCDTRPCVEPDHLVLGTHAQNMRDMADRHRAVGQPGEQHHKAKLTEDDVRRIRALCAQGVRHRAIAEAFGVTTMNISSIATRRSWKHVV